MDAIVLAGGFGTRLRDLVPDLPKPMAPVAGRQFLEIVLGALAQKGFRRTVLSLGYKAETIVTHFDNSFAGMSLAYAIEDSPLGTGGALRQALQRCKMDHAFVFNGDTFLDLEVADLAACWEASRVPIIVAREVPDTARYGKLATADGRVIGFREKGAGGSGLVNAGCYVLPTDILQDFAMGSAFSLEADFLAQAVGRQRIDVFVTEGYFIDIGIPADYIRAQTECRTCGVNARKFRSINCCLWTTNNRWKAF